MSAAPRFDARDPAAAAFWDERFAAGFTPWDAGGVPPPFARWLHAPIRMRRGESWAGNLRLPMPCASPSVQALSIQPFDPAADRAPGAAAEQARAGGATAGHWTPN